MLIGKNAEHETLGVTCPLGSLVPGSTATFEVDLDPSSSGIMLTNKATVSSKARDGNGANNSVTISAPVHRGVALPASCSAAVSTGPTDRAYWPGYTQILTVPSPQNLLLELRPEANFEGYLAAGLHRLGEGAPVAAVGGLFIAGKLIEGTALTRVNLAAGDYRLEVQVKSAVVKIGPYATPDEVWVCLFRDGGCTPVVRVPYFVIHEKYLYTATGNFSAWVS